MPAIPKATFLIDENISVNLKPLLESFNFGVETVYDLDKNGAKNSELIEIARIRNKILISSDKDFLYLHKAMEIPLIIVDIHPIIDEKLIKAFEKILIEFDFAVLKENILIIRENDYELKKKDIKKKF